ncbi:KUP/HAK/KT family potassium transporter [Desulfitobacterium metallireducens]|uniref:Probable potassium transport system protein Kup n=1 Tax=Desulfitobacterium metallireducens DSM 15288 TaxID=871968 RepID=W0ECL0_9FIRM|nr:KUP/HAK/KT family potassium transporter [Desulfitobacterium metallireducens]AHF07243.1 potassium transporter Kup [Desulfitobacterium metallireducens DSM 15288]
MEKALNIYKERPLTLAGMLVTIGVVYGDIGTSPLYVMQALVEGNGGLKSLSNEFIYGSLSLIFWTLTLLTTIKYVLIALKADNHGEGGILALYSLIRKMGGWLIVPAMIGGAALLADGVLTPAVTVTTAVEGLKGIPAYANSFGSSQSTVILITIIILCVLFLIQRTGTEIIGRLFGPIMILWFTMLGILGVIHIFGNLDILKSFSPYYGVKLLFSDENKVGFAILGSVFLATTGAEALYSDLGHVGRKNIYGTWPFVKICLLLNYFGQGAWLLQVKDNQGLQNIMDFNPFFELMPHNFRIIGVVFATLAAIIASQALISGSFTLVSEAIKLDLLPRLRINYPAMSKGQMYIPIVNFLLMISCIGVVLFFQTSTHMESAYGLAITITMLMTTILLFNYLLQKKVSRVLALLMVIIFGVLETAFFVSSAVKFFHGGFITVIIASLILILMFLWLKATQLEQVVTKEVSLEDYISKLDNLRKDEHIPVYATNLVYLTSKSKSGHIDNEIIYSILDKRPKRAEVYWFINVQVTDEPRTMAYTVENFGTDYVYKIQLRLGFRVEQKVSTYLRQVVTDLMESHELKQQPQMYSTNVVNRNVGDFCFVLVREELAHDTNLPLYERLIMQFKLSIKQITVSPVKWFGLEHTDVKVEHVPLRLGTTRPIKLKRELL